MPTDNDNLSIESSIESTGTNSTQESGKDVPQIAEETPVPGKAPDGEENRELSSENARIPEWQKRIPQEDVIKAILDNKSQTRSNLGPHWIIMLGAPDELSKKAEQLVDALDGEEMDRDTRAMTENRLANLMEAASAFDRQFTQEADLDIEGLTQLTGRLPKHDRILNRATGKGELNGRQAELTVIANSSGAFKLDLYNSGFYVYIRPLRTAELDAWYRVVDLSNRKLGHSLGRVFYGCNDFVLKREFLRFFARSIVDSNLKGWQDSKVFIENLSLADYQACTWAASVLLYQTGVEIPLYCAKEGCDYSTTEFKIDLVEIRVDNPDVIPIAELSEQLAKTKVTPEELAVWRGRKEFRSTGDYGPVGSFQPTRYRFKVPTAAEYFQVSEMMVAKLKDSFSSGDDPGADEMRVRNLIVYFYSLLPWVDTISGIPECGCAEDQVVWTTGTKSAIDLSLDPQFHENTTLYKDFREFTVRTRISFFGYAPSVCPKCGAEITAEFTASDLVPVDCQQLFFVLAYQTTLSLVG